MQIVMRTLPPPLPKHLVMYNYMFQSLIVGLYDQEDEEKLVYTGVIKPIWPLDGSEPQLEVNIWSLDGKQHARRASPASKMPDDVAIAQEALMLADLCVKALEETDVTHHN